MTAFQLGDCAAAPRVLPYADRRIWLDDMRGAPPGWTRCFSPDEVIELLEFREVEEISLDYDLGLVDDRAIDWNGEDVLRWIELQVVEQGDAFPFPINSADPVGGRRMQHAPRSIQRRAGKPLKSEVPHPGT